MRRKKRVDCDLCQKAFNSMVYLRLRNESIHEGVTHDCVKCNMKFHFKCSLILHVVQKIIDPHLIFVTNIRNIQIHFCCTGCTKKNASQQFVSYFCSGSGILLFRMCFIIRILSQFHRDIQTMPILNLNCLKNAKNACVDVRFSPNFYPAPSLYNQQHCALKERLRKFGGLSNL